MSLTDWLGPQEWQAVRLSLWVAGVATLASVKWGLKDDGIGCIVVVLAALISARLLCATRIRASVAVG